LRISLCSTTPLFPPPHQTIDKAHGRLEVRTLRASTLLNDYLKFPYCRQVIKIERESTHLKTGKIQTETVYAITSLTPQQANAERLLALNRGHWGIENRSHYVRDMAFDEDRHQVRTKKGPQMMACLRNLAISILRLFGAQNIAGALRQCAANRHLTLQYLGL
jgi:predicted transposase YbfD/YdcC